MIAAIETYLAVRRTAGFTLSNTEYLLRSFASFATAQKQTWVTGVEISCTRNSTSLGTAFRPGDRRIIGESSSSTSVRA